ncbi:MAG: alpha/beta hydrolase [Proteobacteria bacterium]|nr:MAG: alpha/beta hydrolase [Pseudomonadota bacterium]
MPIDPQCQAIIDAAAQVGSPFDQGDHRAVRIAYRATTAAYRHPSGELDSVINRGFPGPAGEVPIRIYRPLQVKPGAYPCLIFFHGGGWVFGDLDTHDHVCRYLAHGATAIVLSVDYRLAPEHKFPAALEDCIAAVRWVVDSADELGIDVQRLAVGGDSAGGNLAAATAIALRDTGGAPLVLQLLIYPAVDFTADDQSLTDNATGYLLTRDALEMFTDLYLPNREARSDPRASPQLHANHTDLARAFVQSAEFDPLRDQARTYANTLLAAGCLVDHKCYRGMVHGFMRMGAKVDTALAALDDACGVLREVFGRS